MASVQLLLDLADDLDNLSPYYSGCGFGLGVNPHHFNRYQRPSFCHLPLAALANRMDNNQLMRRSKGKVDGAVSNIGKDGFQVCMDVQQFKPSELSVKVIDNAVVVEAKHEEREDDHGFISRHFVRRYALPKDYDSDKVISTLSSDGVLTVSVPKPLLEDKSNEKVIQIQQTGPAHLNVKENQQDVPADTGAVAVKAKKQIESGSAKK